MECKPECQVNNDCPNDKACMSQRCRDPCPGSCGAGADCRVVGHNPICSCPPGYTGDPLESCRLQPPVEPVETDPCDPDPCGPYSQKYEQEGHCVCSCLPGYIGVAPNCRPECIVSSECSLTTACVDYTCVDPCVGDICGINARYDFK